MPSVSISPPKNIQIPYQAMSIYTRTLPNNATTCTEMFSGIPASVGAILVGLKSTTSGVTENNELYEKGSLITKASISLGSLQLPTPEYDISFPNRKFGRVFADWLSLAAKRKRHRLQLLPLRILRA